MQPGSGLGELKMDRVNMHACCEAFERLYSFSTESDVLNHGSEFYEEGDERAPFFTEAFLYNLVGKEDARSILALIRQLGRALGFDDADFDSMSDRKMKA